jgi:betaine-aldehyde dehydrogenase
MVEAGVKVQPEASHFIHGAAVEDAAGAAMAVIYPATGEVIATVHAATPGVVARAVASAREGQAEWAATPPAVRGRVLRRAAEIIRARNRELSELETLDTGKPLAETLVADWASGADCLEWFGTLAAGIAGEHIDLGGDFVLTRREPLGVCVGIGAWNYPSQIACWKAAPALACGNAMVFKPSELTPLGALKLAEILIEAGAGRASSTWCRGPARSGRRWGRIPTWRRSRSPDRCRPGTRSMPGRPRG